MSEIVSEFLKEYMQREPYASKEQIADIISEVEKMVARGRPLEELEQIENKEKLIEDVIDNLITENVQEFEQFRQKYGVPGYSTSIKIHNYSIKLYGGNLNHLGEKLPPNALFDIASMTKFYTQIVAYNLIRDGVFKRSDRIKDLDPRFQNLEDLTIDEILTFGVDIKTEGDIRKTERVNDARDSLFGSSIARDADGNQIRGTKWVYTDIGLMILKEVMEKLTGLTYPELVDKYIIYPLHLTNTHIIVPKQKIEFITGTPNFKEARINDMKANLLGGYSGHAGVFTTSDDVVRLLMGVRDEKILPNYQDAYTLGNLNDYIAKMGSNYVAHPNGLEKSYIETFEPHDTFAIAGSTRVNAASFGDGAYSVMLNPASIDPELAREKEANINAKRMQWATENKREYKPIEVIKQYSVQNNGQKEDYTLIDPRQIVTLDPYAEAVSHVAKTTLKIRFLDFLIKQYDKSINEVNIVRNNK